MKVAFIAGSRKLYLLSEHPVTSGEIADHVSRSEQKNKSEQEEKEKVYILIHDVILMFTFRIVM